MKKRITILLLALALINSNSGWLLGQNSWTIKNPSFEKDEARVGRVPQDWINCSATSNAAPDLHATNGDLYFVQETAFDGNNFLGLMLRKNGDYEGICQELETPMPPGQSYRLSFYVKTTPKYGYELRRKFINHTDHPAIIQIWGCNLGCELAELLVESNGIDNKQEWQLLHFEFTPKDTVKVIRIELAFADINAYPNFYNSHVLIDKVSDINRIDLKDHIPLFIEDKLFAYFPLKEGNEVQLEEIVAELHKEYTTQDYPLPDLADLKLKYIFLTQKVERDIEQQDIRRYIMQVDDLSLRLILNSLDVLGHLELKALLEDAYVLRQKRSSGNISPEEIAAFDNLTDRYEDIDPGKAYRVDYIRDHYDEILEELKTTFN